MVLILVPLRRVTPPGPALSQCGRQVTGGGVQDLTVGVLGFPSLTPSGLAPPLGPRVFSSHPTPPFSGSSLAAQALRPFLCSPMGR